MIKCSKKILGATLVILGAITLTGCHGSGKMAPFEIPDSLDTSKTYEITFWAKNDTNKTQTDIYNRAISDFTKLYPNIHVNMRLYTDYGRIYNDVITNISTNTTPNVCITYPDHISTYLTGANTVVPLDELFDDPRYGLGGSEIRFDAPLKDEIVPKFLDECIIGENHYAIPYMRSTEACYVNKTLLESMGYELPDKLTWDFVFEVSKEATRKDSNGDYIANGQKVMIPFIYKSTDNMMIQMLKQADGGYSDSEGNILIFNDTTKSILESVRVSAEAEAFSTFKISSYPGNFLNAGQCIFAIDSTAGATWMGSNAPLSDISEDKVVSFETAVLPIPQYDVENPRMISQGPSICIFNKNDNGEVLASWLFAQYLLSNEVQTAYAETEGYIPVTLKAIQSDEYVDYLSREGEDNEKYYDVKIKASKLLIDNIDNTFVTPVFNGSASLRDAAGQMIENVTKSVRRKETVNDEYYRNLYASVTSLYRLDSHSIDRNKTDKSSLGALPFESKALITALIIVWVLIAIYAISQWFFKKRLLK